MRCLVPSLALSVALIGNVARAIPLTHSLSQGVKECLMERLEANEHMTVSVFITSGASLKGEIEIQGPISPLHDDKGTDEARMIFADSQRYDKGTRYGVKIIHGSVAPPRGTDLKAYEVNFSEKVDFEKLVEEEVRFDYDDFFEDEDDEYPRLYHEIVGDDDELSEEEHDRREAQFEKAKKRMQEKNKKKKTPNKKNGLKEDSHIVREGEPWQMTFQVKSPGYYRSCLTSGWHPISAEIEIRKSSELGAPDPKTGHLVTHERRAMVQAEKLYVADAAKEKDLDGMHNQLRQLTRLLGEIRRKQDIERHQLTLHKTLNAHSHSRMVMTSLVETILYMAITGYQVYTIRNWFKGSPMLG
jgi:hypothetical protein